MYNECCSVIYQIIFNGEAYMWDGIRVVLSCSTCENIRTSSIQASNDGMNLFQYLEWVNVRTTNYLTYKVYKVFEKNRNYTIQNHWHWCTFGIVFLALVNQAKLTLSRSNYLYCENIKLENRIINSKEIVTCLCDIL